MRKFEHYSTKVFLQTAYFDGCIISHTTALKRMLQRDMPPCNMAAVLVVDGMASLLPRVCAVIGTCKSSTKKDIMFPIGEITGCYLSLNLSEFGDCHKLRSVCGDDR